MIETYIHILSFQELNPDDPELSRMVRLFNVLGVSFSLGILKAPIEPLLEAIEDTFSKKPSIVDLNKKAANFSYNYASAKFSDFNSSISKIDKESNSLSSDAGVIG